MQSPPGVKHKPKSDETPVKTKGVDFIPSPAKVLQNVFDDQLDYEDYEGDILDHDEISFFDKAEKDVMLLYDLVDAVRQKQNKRMNDSDAEKILDLQEDLRLFIETFRKKFLYMKLEVGEKNLSQSQKLFEEVRMINNRLSILEGRRDETVARDSPVSSTKASSPVSVLPMSFAAKTLAT